MASESDSRPILTFPQLDGRQKSLETLMTGEKCILIYRREAGAGPEGRPEGADWLLGKMEMRLLIKQANGEGSIDSRLIVRGIRCRRR